jgi:hypothetical protein
MTPMEVSMRWYEFYGAFNGCMISLGRNIGQIIIAGGGVLWASVFLGSRPVDIACMCSTD